MEENHTKKNSKCSHQKSVSYPNFPHLTHLILHTYTTYLRVFLMVIFQFTTFRTNN